jgi:hypothetical protein
VLNRCAVRTLIAGETAELRADHEPHALAATIGSVWASPTRRVPAGWFARSMAKASPRERSSR